MSKSGKSESPRRSCISCRTERDKGALLRFVLAPDGVLTPDLESRLPGRGAYTCISKKCLLDAVKRRQFTRVFKGEAAPVAGDTLAALVQHLMEERIGGYVALATKAGATVSGGEAVERLLKGGKPPQLLILAEDLSSTIAEKLEGQALRGNVPVLKALDKEKLGILLGKGSDRSAVAITSQGFASSLTREIERYRNYLEEESGQ